MENTLPYQPRFKVEVGDTDITDSVDGGVSVTYELMRISRATFTITKDSEAFSVKLSRGSSVVIYGGYVDEVERYNNGSAASATHYGRVFSGHVQNVALNYKEDGSCDFVVSCVDFSWSISAITEEIYRYPARGSSRAWANVDKIKTSELITKLVDDMGMDLDIDLGDNPDIVYTLKEPFCQVNETDFVLLNKLALKCGCYVWWDSQIKDGETTPTPILHFKSRKVVLENKGTVINGGRPEFIWLGRVNRDFTPSEPHKGAYGSTGQREMLGPNQIKLLTASVTEDPQIYGTPVTRIEDFDEITGESVSRYVAYDEKNGDIIYYELDQTAVDALMKDEEGRKVADALTNFGMFNIPWENPSNTRLAAKTYFKEKRISKDIIDSIDSPAFGITISAKCDGDLRIRPQQSYIIRGISRYGHSANTLKFFIKELTHQWDTDGFTTLMEFRA